MDDLGRRENEARLHAFKSADSACEIPRLLSGRRTFGIIQVQAYPGLDLHNQVVEKRERIAVRLEELADKELARKAALVRELKRVFLVELIERVARHNLAVRIG